MTAIDTALGASASSIVVDTASDGKRCIEYLKRTDGGRATFLPLDTIRPNLLRENGLETQKGCFGTADRLVVFDGRYAAIVQNLLARTVVCENMDTALALARTYGHRFRIVTLDGQVFQAGGAMTGGSASRGTGALARAGRLRAAQEQAKALEKQKQEAERAFHAAKEELAALDYDLKAIEAERARAAQEEAGLRASVSQHGTLLESLQSQYDGLVLERDNLAAARQRYQETIAQCGQKQDEARQALANAEAAGEQCRAAQEALDTQAAGHTSQTVSVQTELAENRSEAASEARALADLERLKAELDAGVSGSAGTIAGFEEEIARLTEALSRAQDAEEENRAAAAQLNEQIAAQMQQRERVEGERAQVDREAQGKNEEILGLERESARLENRSVQLKNEEAQILDKMWESYELTPTPAREAARPLEDISAAKEQVQSLRGRMRALGNVNLDAVEEYRQALERYTLWAGRRTTWKKRRKSFTRSLNS